MRARWLASALFFVALVAATALASCSSSGQGDGTKGDVFENRAAGVALTVPNGWHATMRHFTPLLDPYERATLTSYPVEDAAQSRGCSPGGLLEQMPRSGVSASLLEYLDAAQRRHVKPRPRHFHLGKEVFPGFECFWPPRGRADAYAFNFGASGRAFLLLVAVGKKATPETRQVAAAALDRIRIEPCDRPSPSEVKAACRRPLPH